MNTIKPIHFVILAFIMICVWGGLYLIFAFVKADLNPFNWSEDCRVLFAFLGIAGMVFPVGVFLNLIVESK